MEGEIGWNRRYRYKRTGRLKEIWNGKTKQYGRRARIEGRRDEREDGM